MFAIAAMGAVCAAGIGFYVRFLLALCTRCIHRQICYLVRLEPGRNEDPTPELLETDKSLRRAA